MPIPRPRSLVALGLAAGLVTGCAGGATPEPSADPSPTRTTSAPDPTGTMPESAPTDPGTARVVDHLLEVPPLHPSVDGYDETRLAIETADGTVHRLAVKVARSREEQLHGLMEVQDLPDGTGMWFVFDAERDGGFWMFQTLVPLSIAYIGADGRIVDLLDMEPCPPEDDRDCPSYPPGGDYLTALEVPQGWFDRNGIAEGDLVREVGG